MKARLLAVVAVAAALAATGSVVARDPGPTTCDGHPATVVGTSGTDDLVGTPGPDVIVGLGGSDVVAGLGGDDVLCGGSGADWLRGGPGADAAYQVTVGDVLAGIEDVPDAARPDGLATRAPSP